MGVLEQITQMKSQNTPDDEIIRRLGEQGVSPKEINDALSQSQIKSAVSNTGGAEEMKPATTGQVPPTPSQQEGPSAPSQPEQGSYTPKTQEMPELPRTEQEMYSPQPQQQYPQPQQEYPQQQEFYQQQDAYNYPAEGVSSDTIIEIAEQVFSEKIKKIQKQVENINEFKTLAQTKIDNTSDRLKKIETIIDKLQIAILEKIASYGKNIESIKKEMGMMQDSFGKVVNQAVRGHKSHTTHTPAKTAKIKKTSKKK